MTVSEMTEAVKGINNVDLSDYLKNNDARPNEYFDVAYEGITLRGAGDSDGTSAIGVDTYGVQAYATGEGYSYFYLGADGSVQIIGDKELLINNKSFNKLYEDVQLLKGSYDLIDSPSGVGYEIAVSSNTEKYAMISQIGGMSYKSNNLLVLDDFDETTLNGITYSVKEGIIKLSGTSTSSVFITLPIKSINLNGSYARNGFNNFANTTYDDIYLRFRNDSAGAFESNFLYFNAQNKTATMTYDNVTYDQLAINIKSDITCSNYVIKPMLVSSSTAPTTWELGFEGIRHTKVTNIIHRSSNLIQLDDVSSTTKNGITYKVKDGVVTLNGTTTSAFGINLPLVNSIPVGTYTLNRFGDKGTDGSTFGICYSNAWEMGVQIAFNNDTTYKTATITNEGTYLRLYLNSNGTYSNYTLKPMLVRGSTIPADFSPYAEYANISLNNLYEMDGYGLGINDTCYNYLDFDKDVLVRRVKEIDLSTLNWTITQVGTENERFKAKFTDIRLDGVINSQMVVSGEYVRGTSSQVYNHTLDKSIAIEAANYFVVYDSRYINNLTGFKEYLQNNPTKIIYELIESTEVAIPEINTFFDASKGGVIIFENEHKQVVPCEIKYIKVV